MAVNTQPQDHILLLSVQVGDHKLATLLLNLKTNGTNPIRIYYCQKLKVKVIFHANQRDFSPDRRDFSPHDVTKRRYAP